MTKNSFIIYHNYREKLQSLSDAQVGKLFRALLDYSIEGIEPKLSGALKVAFQFIKVTMDEDRQKYDSICEKRKESGSLGGKQKVANASTCKQKVANVADNDNDNDNDIYKYILYECQRLAPILYTRFETKPNAEETLKNILKNIKLTKEGVSILLQKVNDTYIVNSKYGSLDLCWVLTHKEAVLKAAAKSNSPKAIIKNKNQESQLERAAKSLGVKI